MPFNMAMGSIRFSLGRFNTPDEIDIAIEAVVRAVEKASRNCRHAELGQAAFSMPYRDSFR